MKPWRLLLAVVFLSVAVVAGAVNLKKFKPTPRKFQKRTPVAVAGVRGLSEPGDAGDLSARDTEAVDWLESLTLTAKDLEKFLKEGKLPS